MVKKLSVWCVAFSLLLISLSLISANLDIQKEIISPVAIKDLNVPAEITLTIKNLGDSDTFRIYSLVGIDLQPNESFSLAHDQTKIINLDAYPSIALKTSPDYYSFEYKIAGEKSGIQTDELAITLAYLKDAFNFYIEDISPTSTKAVIHFDNRGGHEYKNINVDFSSAFFNEIANFSLAPILNARKESKKGRHAPICPQGALQPERKPA